MVHVNEQYQREAVTISTQILLLLSQLIFSSGAEHIDIHRNGGEIKINVDGQEYRSIQPIIGDSWEYNPEKQKEELSK